MILEMRIKFKAFDKVCAFNYEKIMRISFVKASLFVSAISLPLSPINDDLHEGPRVKYIEPFGSEPNDTHSWPPVSETFHLASQGKHQVFAMTSTAKASGHMLAEISRMAQRDVMIVEPSKFPQTSYKSFLTMLGYDDLDRQSVRGKASQLILDQLGTNMDNLFGKNYSAGLADKDADSACIITGEMRPGLIKLSHQLGAIPMSLESDKLNNQFGDSKSILVFTLLHEASHCASHNQKDSDHRAAEIDADRAAIGRYKELVRLGWNIDPYLPEKVRALRLLAPLFYTSTDWKHTFNEIMDAHSSAGGFDSSEVKAADYLKRSALFRIAVTNAVYDLLPDREKRKLYQTVKSNLEAEFSAGQRSIILNLPLMPENEAKQAKMVLKLSTLFQPVIAKMIIANLAQNKDRSLTFKALKSLSHSKDDIVIAPLGKINLAQAARERLTAWEFLGLKSESSWEVPQPSSHGVLLNDFKQLMRAMNVEVKQYMASIATPHP